MQNGVKWLTNLWGEQKAKEVYKAWGIVFDLEKTEVKEVLKDLAVYCNINKSSFVVNDAYQTAFNEGARDVFLHIIEMVNLDLQQLYYQKNNDKLKG
ncbi:hypothetical protein ACFX5K_02800 [Rickettsiales bacterium LUAb2]